MTGRRRSVVQRNERDAAQEPPCSPPSASTAAPLPVRSLPGPRLPRSLQTLRHAVLGTHSLERFSAFGDRFRCEVWAPRGRADPGHAPLVRATLLVLSAPEDLRAAFTASPEDLSTGHARGFIEWWVGAESVLVLDGDAHARERAVLRPLLGHHALKSYHGPAAATAAELLDALPASGRVELGPLLDEMVLRVSVRLLLGHTSADALDRAREFVRCSIDSGVWADAALLYPPLRRLPAVWPAARRAAAAERAFEALLAEEVALRRSPAGRPGGDAMLDRLLAAEAAADADGSRPARRRARVRTLFGGIDTLSAGLRWCALRLLREPAALARAAEEAHSRAGATPAELPYLEAVVKETFRLDPPVPAAVRRARRDVTLAGLAVEGGTYLVLAPALAHRRAQTFPEPERFRPERFLERSYSAWEYVTFGGGRRHCLGKDLAVHQSVVLLATLLRALELRPLGGYRLARRRRASMVTPRDPLEVEYRRRS